MNCCAQQESVSTHTNININKCALKLVGFEYGNFTDEELLEFISYYVPASAIKAIFYDSYNRFYVLHLNDVEFTSVLIGKTLRFGTDHISFLPLLDCFVIGNVYPSLSNNDIFEIFSVFGKVFDVSNYHVLPNSSKFFHVLSGTREVSFLLTGCESKVEIPTNVVHSPYIFHTQKFCVGCQTQGHSLMNCPDKMDEEVSLPNVLQSCSPVNNHFVQELTIKVNDVKTIAQFEKHSDANLPEKPDESIQLPKHAESSLLEIPKEDIQLQKHVENNLVEEVEGNVFFEKPVENILSKENNTETDSVEEKPKISLLGAKIRKITEKQQQCRIKMVKRKRKELAKKSRNALSDIVEVKHPSPKKIISECPSPVKSCILKSKGVIPVKALNELLLLDARNKGNIISFVFQFTSNIRAVLVQLSELKKELDLTMDIKNKAHDVMFKKKIFTIAKLLNKVLRNSY